MKNFLARTICLSLLLTKMAFANEIHLVSIEKLIEQEVGRIILGRIYDSLNIEYTIKPLPGKRAFYELKNGLADGEVMRIYDYGKLSPDSIRIPTPYYSLETMAFFKKESNLKGLGPQDLNKYRIAIVRGVRHTADITEGYPNIIQLNSTEQAMRFVLKDRADIALTNTADGLMVLKNHRIEGMAHLEKPLKTLPLYHYLHKSKKELVPILDAKFIELMKNGELNTIIKDAEDAVLNLHSN